jgi:hypothetical protein
MTTNFKKLKSLNVNDFTEKKQGLTYLSWSHAWEIFVEAYPNATYSFDDVKQIGTGMMCFTSVTAGDLTHRMMLPVLDNRMKPVLAKDCDSFMINKTFMRCFVKNLAMFGLGLYLYKGDDLPDETNAIPPSREELQKGSNESVAKLVSYTTYDAFKRAYISLRSTLTDEDNLSMIEHGKALKEFETANQTN